MLVQSRVKLRGTLVFVLARPRFSKKKEKRTKKEKRKKKLKLTCIDIVRQGFSESGSELRSLLAIMNNYVRFSIYDFSCGQLPVRGEFLSFSILNLSWGANFHFTIMGNFHFKIMGNFQNVSQKNVILKILLMLIVRHF